MKREAIEITKDWIIRLKFYVDSVKESIEEEDQDRLNRDLSALIGYLESLDYLLNNKYESKN